MSIMKCKSTYLSSLKKYVQPIPANQVMLLAKHYNVKATLMLK